MASVTRHGCASFASAAPSLSRSRSALWRGGVTVVVICLANTFSAVMVGSGCCPRRLRRWAWSTRMYDAVTEVRSRAGLLTGRWWGRRRTSAVRRPQSVESSWRRRVGAADSVPPGPSSCLRQKVTWGHFDSGSLIRRGVATHFWLGGDPFQRSLSGWISGMTCVFLWHW